TDPPVQGKTARPETPCPGFAAPTRFLLVDGPASWYIEPARADNAIDPRPSLRGVLPMTDDVKLDFCRAARVLFRAGLSVGIAGHMSYKTGPDRMLANRFGPSFGTVMPDDLLTLDLNGNLIERSEERRVGKE